MQSTNYSVPPMSPADNDARLAALLLAIDPRGLKGAIVRGRSPLMCEQWLEFYSALMPPDSPSKRVPSNISEERLLGGLDFAATLSRGVAVCERGVLAMAHGGSVVMQASTTRNSTFTHVARALDRGGVSVERDGFSETHASTFCAITIECADDEVVPASMADRVAFVASLNDTTRQTWTNVPSREIVMAARQRLNQVHCSDSCIEAMTRGASKLGVTSSRAILLTLATARAHAALLSHEMILDSDIACAARLVLAPRATVLPDNEGHETEKGESPDDQKRETVDEAQSRNEQQLRERQAQEFERTEPDNSDSQKNELANDAATLTDVVIRAAAAALPAGLLAAAAAKVSGANKSVGRAGSETQNGARGRQVGVRRGEPRGGARLDLVATLRAAVPLQRVRREARTEGAARVVELRRDDFRLRRCSTPTTTTTLFVVDASGSAALHRLAEAKGAVELMLAEGYARRDKVALIAFRGTAAELVLPPTHALARARRAVAGMPAGGGTPLATALDVAATTVMQIRRDTSQVVMVILTDGRANVARDGKGGRARAESEAMDAAQRIRALGVDAVWIDTSQRTDSLSRNLAQNAGARYLLLPAPNARGLTDVARAARSDQVKSDAAQAQRVVRSA
ncbi:MAG: VWA domain-containing protein [Gemmatimonadaceae bacterium]